MPQWQGGNLTEYHLGARLLSWLLWPADGPEEIVPVPVPSSLDTLNVEDCILAKGTLLEQARAARAIIEKHQPGQSADTRRRLPGRFRPIAYLKWPR